MLSTGPMDIDPRHSDPMLDEALGPSPQVLPAVIGPVGCSAWGDDVWLTHGASLVGSEESVDPMCSKATFWSPRPRGCSSSSVVQSLAHSTLSPEETLGFNAPNVLVEPVVEVCNVVAKVAQNKAAPLSLEDFLNKVTCPLPQPLLETPVPSHGEKDDG